MKKIIVAVGSTRRPKLNAVWEAVSVFGPTLDPNSQFEVIGVEGESGVRHTPLARADIMACGRNRAEALAELASQETLTCEDFVGLEGRLAVVGIGGFRRAFLVHWSFAGDGGW